MVITIARQAGSGGHDVAVAVANRLELPVISREQIDRAAAAVGVGRQPLDEARVPAIARRIVEILAGREDLKGRLTAPADSFPSTRNPEYRTLTGLVLRGLIEQISAVVMGNGAQFVLRGWPKSTHVFVTAPLPVRVRCVAMREDLEAGTAEKVVRESDRERADYIRRFYGARWDDPLAYDLVFNTAQISVEQAAQGVVLAAAM